MEKKEEMINIKGERRRFVVNLQQDLEEISEGVEELLIILEQEEVEEKILLLVDVVKEKEWGNKKKN